MSIYPISSRTLLVGFVLLAGLLAGSGCASGTKARDKTPTGQQVAQESLELDPMLVRVKPGTNETESIEVEEVFDKAFKAYRNRRYEDAAKHYELIIRYFADSRFYLPALYNGGLAYEELGLWDSAIQSYNKVIEQYPDNKEATDAHYRLANVYDRQDDQEQIVALMTQVMTREISHFDRIEAYARRSGALLKLNRLDEAEEGFRTLLRLNEKAPEDEQVLENSNFIVQSYYGIGRVYHLRVSAIPLVLPPERMGDDLQVKADLFLRAQSNYIRALRYHHPQWSVAAGYMIGRMYEDFYVDLFTAEIPAELTDEEFAMYFEELRSQIKPLMERAVQVYERNLSFSQRLADTPEAQRWASETATQLMRLRAYLNDPQTQRRAEKLVRQGRPLSELWDVGIFARETVQEAIAAAQKKALSAKVNRGQVLL